MKKIYIFVGLVLVALPVYLTLFNAGEAPAQLQPAVQPAQTAQVNPHLQAVLNEFENEILSLKNQSKIPGAAIAVVKDSVIVYLKGFGVRRVGSKDSIDVNTVFRIASVSKCFAAFLTGILVEDSVLRWDDRVRTYLPDFSLKSEQHTERLTLRHVLSHTTGLPFHAYTTLVEDGLPLETMLGRLKDVDLATDVGKIYSYQNVAYSLIGEVIRSATEKSYEAWMVEKVFRPLSMKNASIDYFSMITSPNHAKPHMPVRGGWKPAKINITYYNVAPAGGVNASIADMANWMVALLGHRPDVIHPETLNQLYFPIVKAPSKNRNYGRMQRLRETFYGLGWRILHYPEDTLVYHGGYVNGFRSEVAVNQKEGLAVCILANGSGELPDNGIPLFFKIYNRKRKAIREWDEQFRESLVLNP